MSTGERPKMLYVIVEDEGSSSGSGEHEQRRRGPAPRYTRSVLQSTLQLMGCKPRHAFKISDRVFEVLRKEVPAKKTKVLRRHRSEAEAFWHVYESLDLQQTDPDPVNQADANQVCKSPKSSTKKRSTVTVARDKFLDVVCDALAEYQYVGPNQRADLALACRVREKKSSVTILLCGTSGCGKSTLSSLLASRLGITTVVSTDSVRHMMRSFVSEKENPLLWASTYHAGEFLDPVAVGEAKAKKKEAKMASIPLRTSSLESRPCSTPTTFESRAKLDFTKRSASGSLVPCLKGKAECAPEGGTTEGAEAVVSSKTMAVQGFKAQSEMVIDSLDRLVTAWEQKNESVVIEGVHLSLNFVMGLMKKHPSIIPFMVYISNEGKHLERFAVRAKYMTLDPARNKYVKYIRNIRTIQEYLCKRADKHLVPKVNNTNVDKSIALIHATIFGCLRRREGGEPLFDQTTNTVKVVDQEYRSQSAASSLGSKGMFQLIQRRGSSRHLMALMNTDGSVAKAWPLETDSGWKSSSSTCGDSGVGTPVYGPLAIGKAEPVNLQFGNFGLSAWLTDLGAASYNGSGDGHSSRGDGDLSRPESSCSSSPKHGDGAEKELTEDVAVSGSDEEADEEQRVGDSDGEMSDIEGHHLEGDDDGSVDEESIRSDEDAEEFATSAHHDDGFWEDDENEGKAEEGTVEQDAVGSLPPRLGRVYSRGRSSVSEKPQTLTVVRAGSLPFRLTEAMSHEGRKCLVALSSTENRCHSRSKSLPNWDYNFLKDGLVVNAESNGHAVMEKAA